jgi:uracil-DNA glycosylase family 4
VDKILCCGGTCKFYKPRVAWKGNPEHSFVIVGESPGSEECLSVDPKTNPTGTPFVGPSGFILNEILKDYPDLQDPFCTNAIQCRPGTSKKLETLPDAVNECRPRLLKELAYAPRRIILALGNAAVWSLTGDTTTKITRIRGRNIASPYAELGILPTVHPAYLLRGGGSLRQFRADIDHAVALWRGEAVRTFTPPTWEVVSTSRRLLEIVEAHANEPYAAGDIETTGFSPWSDEILSLGWTYNGKHIYIADQSLVPYYNYVFRGQRTKWRWHNGKFDIKFLRWQGAQNAFVHDDTMLQSYVLDETRGVHDLEQVAGDWLNSPNWKGILDGYKPKGKAAKSWNYGHIPKPVLYQYQAYDIANTFNLGEIFAPQIISDKRNKRLYEDLLIPASEYLADVESNGLMVNVEQVHHNATKYEAKCEVYREQMNEICQQVTGHDINPNSPAQLVDLLYDQLRIPTRKRSTNKEVLKKLPSHAFLSSLNQYRKDYKALTTYIRPLLEMVEYDGRVHPTFLIHGTATGRLACRNPNLQNIPRLTELRNMFMAAPGHIFLEVDLSQAELRVLAQLSGDEALSAIYLDPNSPSIHHVVSTRLFGSNYDEEQKMRAKACTFGIVYGREAPSLADEFNVTNDEAQSWIDGWFQTFPGAYKFLMACNDAPIKNLNLQTPFGRRKRVGVVSPEKLKSLQNEAKNFPCQAIASDITLYSGTQFYKRLHNYGVKIVNTVHDSILFELPDIPELVEEVRQIVVEQLQETPRIFGLKKIPFAADAKVGKLWGSYKKPGDPEDSMKEYGKWKASLATN